MSQTPDWPSILEAVRVAGVDIPGECQFRRIAGGGEQTAWQIHARERVFFCKTAHASRATMFAAEHDGLAEMATTQTVRVARPYAHGCVGSSAYLITEWLNFSSANASSSELLGSRLAEMHRTTGDFFGWHRDNTIGLTPQINTATDDWTEFYQQHRLGFQLSLVEQAGEFTTVLDDCCRVMKRLPQLLEGHAPQASLLHGDLWGGNAAVVDGEPVIYDPATYYGDRETDLAMAKLFGGFDARFFASYGAAWPLPDGHEQRLHVYQLYHLLNHLNLFGGGYLGSVQSCLQTILRG